MATFSNDLVAIRKGQKKSIKDVFETSRIPVHIIEQIENGTIFANFESNQVYLRSFIRTYAKALKINENDILKALDAVSNDSYDGFLGEKYSPENLEKSADETEKKTLITDTSKNPQEQLGDEPEPEEEAPNEVSPPKEQQRKKFFTPENFDTPQEKSMRDIEEEDEEAIRTQQTSTAMSESAETAKKVDWAHMVKKGTVLGGNSKSVIIISVAVVIALVIAIVWITDSEVSPDDLLVDEIPQQETIAPTPAEPVPADTLTSTIMPDEATEDATAPVAPPVQQVQPEPEPEPEVPVTEEPATEEIVTMADLVMHGTDAIEDRQQLQVLVYAENGRLEPFFVGMSNGTANLPYWIEQGVAMKINFTEEINIRGQFSRMTILFNGHKVENFMDFFGENRTVSIPRAFFEEEERWATPATEQDVDYTMPSSVINRP